MDRESVIKTLSEFKDSAGWKIMLAALQENIDDVIEQMSDPKLDELPAAEYKVKMTELRNKREDRKNMLNLPDLIIAEATNPEGHIPNFDPYFTTEELNQSEEKE